MPLESYGCLICGKQAPKKLREHGMFAKRMEWLRHHYQVFHPAEYRRRYRR